MSELASPVNGPSLDGNGAQNGGGGGAGGGAPPPGAGNNAPGPAPGAVTNPVLSAIGFGTSNVARTVIDTAKALYSSIFDPWYDAGVSSLNATGVQSLADSVSVRWSMLKATNDALQVMPAQPAEAELVKQAATEVNNTRLMIGQVGLQEYRRQPVLGHYSRVDPGEDPLPFLRHWAERAGAAIATANAVLTECDAAHEGKLDGDQAMRISGLMAQHQEPMEVSWLHQVIVANDKLDEIDSAALPPPKAEAGPFSFPGAADHAGENLGHVFAKEKSKADDQLSLTLDGQDAIDPKKQQEMFRDADAINDEVTSLVDVDSEKVRDIIGKYPVKERAQFFRVLERRNLLANIMHRCDTFVGTPILTLIHETPGYEGWKYDAGLATARSLGEQAVYIADEMARELPGALCQFAAGFFKGLSSLPIVGGLFDSWADGMTDLSKSADKLTGAWDDPQAKKWRDGVAQVTGYACEKIGEVAVTGKLGGVAEVKDAMEVANVGTGLVKTAELVEKLKKGVEEAQEEWPKMMVVVNDGVRLMWDLAAVAGSGDKEIAATALKDFDKGIDDLLDLTGEHVEEHVTAEGQKEKEEEKENKKEAQSRHNVAGLDAMPPEVREDVEKIREANARMLASKDPKDQAVAKADMLAAGDRIKARLTQTGLEVQNRDKEIQENRVVEREKEAKEDDAADRKAKGLPDAPEKNEHLEHAKEFASDTLKGAFIEVVKAVLKKEKAVAVDALKEVIGAEDEGEDDEEVEIKQEGSLYERIMNAAKAGLAEGLADEANEIIKKQVNERLASLLAKELSKVAHLDIDAVIQPAIAEVLGFVETKLQIKKRIEEALDGMLGVEVKEEGHEGGEHKEGGEQHEGGEEHKEAA